MSHRRSFLATSSLAAAALALEPISRSGEPKLKLSLAAYSFRNQLPNYRGGKGTGHSGMQMSDFLDVCANWDLDGAELTSYFLPDPCPTDIALELKRKGHLLGLDISGGAIGNNFAYGPGPELDKQMAYTTHWIEAYAKMGAPVIRVFAGHPKEKGATSAKAIEHIISNLTAACKIAAQHGVILAMENHDFTTDIDRYLEIISAVDSPWFGANLDSGNLAKTDDPYRELERIAPYTVNAQFKVHIPVNGKREAADFPRLIRILKDANYRGYVVLEYEEKEDPMTAIPPLLDALRTAMG